MRKKYTISGLVESFLNGTMDDVMWKSLQSKARNNNKELCKIKFVRVKV